jgi:hypothetical protein
MCVLNLVDRLLVHQLSHRRYLQNAKAEGTNEIHRSFGTDAQSRRRNRLRTTLSRKDGVFGNVWPGAVNLQLPGTQTEEENFAGNGALGQFTFFLISAETTSPQPQPPSTCSGPANIYFSRLGGAGVFRFQRWQSIEGQSHARSRLRRSRGPTGPLYSNSSNHWWNRPFQGCVRHSYVDRDERPGLDRRLKQPRLFCEYARIYGNGLRSRQRGGPPRGAAIGRHISLPSARSARSVHANAEGKETSTAT